MNKLEMIKSSYDELDLDNLNSINVGSENINIDISVDCIDSIYILKKSTEIFLAEGQFKLFIPRNKVIIFKDGSYYSTENEITLKYNQIVEYQIDVRKINSINLYTFADQINGFGESIVKMMLEDPSKIDSIKYGNMEIDGGDITSASILNYRNKFIPEVMFKFGDESELRLQREFTIRYEVIRERKC